ncbi:putative radical SAM protein YgiQ [Halanaerobium saccharolyticum]|uniref:Putative radical SAM protein YgiQ n=1 Tax=Halanaerobium saccharolyticum TaxID=43595 RepID=A0A4R7ZBS1_9FIRM|nr:YgiQ family radical SAM protein [Halanaerobium saccharolyticum]RAK11862.1 putative radical SAM protein YgiQ [Halanaerobium saccharolyticum]TDW07703.1 putative radical SAM protein YgiQ [Halanaerobium saccharolyticum]TDX64624.1 putative radical SAM protein YgiQ [Halanaerobium saccharolyticum]
MEKKKQDLKQKDNEEKLENPRDQFMVISKDDMRKRGWEELDFIIVSGDAYVDHPSFGTAIIARVLEDAGFKVGIIAQPDWRSTADFKKLGKPKFGFLVTAGNMDSMVNHYSVSKHRRSYDNYSPGGESGHRPDRATIVYSNRLREAYGEIPIIIGGIEASLRRFAYYDYWDDSVRRSLLFDSRADLLVYGMGEKQILKIAENLEAGLEIKYINYLPGTAFIADELESLYDYELLPSYEEVKSSKKQYAYAYKIEYLEQDPIRGQQLVQQHGNRYLVQNPPVEPLSQEELDHIYTLPYQRDYHPVYERDGGVPAIKEVKFSLVSSRGCFGACSFCAISFHQGKMMTARSKESLVEEAKQIIALDDFKGYIHDVGGPTANFRKPSCTDQLSRGMCKGKECMFPDPCSKLEVDHEEYFEILRELRKLPEVEKVFVRSGIRFDYLLEDEGSRKYLKELAAHHVSGQLKVAPEHVSDKVLGYMGKPGIEVFDKFRKAFYQVNQEIGLEQYLIPYFISSHPGSRLEDAVELAEYLRDINHHPDQVQDFYPTPGTMATAMYYSGYDPRTMEEVYVAKSVEAKKMQRALLQYHKKENQQIVRKALKMAGRKDLIGYDKKSLVPPTH